MGPSKESRVCIACDTYSAICFELTSQKPIDRVHVSPSGARTQSLTWHFGWAPALSPPHCSLPESELAEDPWRRSHDVTPCVLFPRCHVALPRRPDSRADALTIPPSPSTTPHSTNGLWSKLSRIARIQVESQTSSHQETRGHVAACPGGTMAVSRYPSLEL